MREIDPDGLQGKAALGWLTIPARTRLLFEFTPQPAQQDGAAGTHGDFIDGMD